MYFITEFDDSVCRETLETTLAEMVFRFFFIRNGNKLAFLEKNPLKHALFTLQPKIQQTKIAVTKIQLSLQSRASV